MKYSSIVAAGSLIVCLLGLAPAAEAKSPPGRFVISASGKTVLDTATGLTWLRQDLSPMALTYAGKLLCDLADADGGGWKVPTFRQLTSIIDRTFPPPLYDPSVFLPPKNVNAPFGSSTTFYDPSLGMAFRGLDVKTGAYTSLLPSTSVSIRCVRK